MKIELKGLLTVAVPYLIGVAGCYLFGYWGYFNINVLEFISLADLAKLSVYPLLASLVFFLIGVLINELLFAPFLPPGGGQNTPVGRVGRKYWRFLLVVQIGIIVLIYLLGAEPHKWIIIAFIFSLFSAPLSHLEWISDLLPNPKLRATILFFVLLLPVLSFAFGRKEAYLIKAGYPKLVVDVGRSKLTLTDDPNNPVSYLGFVGGSYVFFEGKTGQVVFVKQRDDVPLYLMQRK